MTRQVRGVPFILVKGRGEGLGLGNDTEFGFRSIEFLCMMDKGETLCGQEVCIKIDETDWFL